MLVPTLQAIQEVFCWSRNPMEVRRLTARKEEIYRQLLGDRTPLIPSGVRQLMEVLGKHQVFSVLLINLVCIPTAASMEHAVLKHTSCTLLSHEFVDAVHC